MKTRNLCFLAVLLVYAVAPLGAQTAEEWIAKARAFLGGDRVLNDVKSIHFTGTLEAGEARLPTDIIFQKPYQQRITVTGPKVIETTALDGYDAWQKRTNPENPTQWQVTLLDATQVKRLRTNTLENLSFYAIRSMPGSEVKLAGEATVDGRACVKLVFTHASNIVFTRFFDKATGQLVKTETENGAEIREEGEMFANGIRFPKRVINRNPNGSVTAITFDKVVVNESFPADIFAVPSLQTR
ncbi:MAG: LolA family protein [Verrucomicrobiota bacterium]